MKIAVTGATGGLGRSLVEKLLEEGHEVVALGRNAQAGKELSAIGATFLKGDINDTAYLTKAFSGADAVVHSAGLASPWGVWEKFYDANVKGTENVLAAMKANNIKKLVHLSSPSVYFSGKSFTQRKEDDPLPEPKTNYSRSKILADELVRKAVETDRISAVLLRPRSIFGKYDATIFPRLIRIMEKGVFPLPGGGKSIVDVTAVENAVHAILLCLESPRYFPGEAINITNGQSLSVRELLELLSKELDIKVRFVSTPMSLMTGIADVLEFFGNHVTKKEPPLSRYSLESLGTTQTLSLEKARLLLGYSPVITLEEAIRRFADGHKKH